MSASGCVLVYAQPFACRELRKFTLDLFAPLFRARQHEIAPQLVDIVVHASDGDVRFAEESCPAVDFPAQASARSKRIIWVPSSATTQRIGRMKRMPAAPVQYIVRGQESPRWLAAVFHAALSTALRGRRSLAWRPCIRRAAWSRSKGPRRRLPAWPRNSLLRAWGSVGVERHRLRRADHFAGDILLSEANRRAGRHKPPRGSKSLDG